MSSDVEFAQKWISNVVSLKLNEIKFIHQLIGNNETRLAALNSTKQSRYAYGFQNSLIRLSLNSNPRSTLAPNKTSRIGITKMLPTLHGNINIPYRIVIKRNRVDRNNPSSLKDHIQYSSFLSSWTNDTIWYQCSKEVATPLRAKYFHSATYRFIVEQHHQIKNGISSSDKRVDNFCTCCSNAPESSRVTIISLSYQMTQRKVPQIQ